jgi:hypothetical protein
MPARLRFRNDTESLFTTLYIEEVYQFDTTAFHREDTVLVMTNDKNRKTTDDRRVAGTFFLATLSGMPPAIS